MPAPVLASPPLSPPAFITVVNWSGITPLHYDYCAADVIVRGNMVVATHGETVTETLAAPTVPRARASNWRTRRSRISTRARWRWWPPRLRIRLCDPGHPAAHYAQQEYAATGGEWAPWQEQQSLLDSSADAHVYRVEIDDDGQATVVFGQGGSGTTDEQFGLRPTPGVAIEALYRTGGGASGNLAADTLVQPHPSEFDAMTWFVS